MGPRKSKRRRPNSPDKDSPISLHALIYALQSPQGVNPSVLKRCYLLLNQLSSIPQCSVICGAESNDCAEEIADDLCKLEDIVAVSDLLFKELAERFEHCFSSLSKEDDSSVSFRWDSFAIVNLLLRCCLLLLTLPQINQEYLFQKGQVVLRILRQLRSAKFKVKKVKGITFERSISSTCGIADDEYAASSTEDFVASLHFLEPSSSCLHFVSAMLEVILDELLMHGQIRSFLKLIDSFIPSGDILCLPLSGHGDVGLLLEVISVHFCLAFSDEQTTEELLNRLFCVEKKNFRYSPRTFEVSPTAATVLLLNPIILSAPRFMQAHVLAFVSEAISSCMDYDDLKPDRRLMNCLLTLLEKSVALYTKHMHNLQLDKSSRDFIKSDNCKDFQPPFESFLMPDTRNRISCLIIKLHNYSKSYLTSSTSDKTKTNVVSSAIAYVKECQDVFDKSFQAEIFSILIRIIMEAYNGVNYGASDASKICCPQDLCILAALLKLMSTSLLRAVSYMRYSGDPEHPKCLTDIYLCKEYNILSTAIGCFANCSLHLPFQHLLCNMMKTCPTRNQNTKMMFLHFSGLLSLSFSMGFDFLIKGSLSTLMALMNLIAFEGNLDMLRQLCDCSSEPFSSGFSSVSIHETHTDQKFSQVIASKFVRTHSMLSRSSRNCITKSQDERLPNIEANSPSDTIGVAVDVEEQTEETSNGEVFLNCILKRGKKAPDFDDLAEFIECKQGKDYSSWLRNRRKYRMWKDQKMAILRWKRKKQTWRIARSKNFLMS